MTELKARITQQMPAIRFLGQSGQALVELVLITPLLMFLAVAVMSLGQAGQKKAMVARAAVSAARVAVVRPDLAHEQALAVLQAGDSGIRPGDVKTKIEPVDIPAWPFSTLTRVTVELEYKPIVGFGWHPTYKLESDFVVDRWVNGIWFDIRK